MQSVQTVRKPIRLPEKLTSVLPLHLTAAIQTCGAPCVEEIRLHSNRISTVTCAGRNFSTGILLRDAEMSDILRNMCGGSLYAYQQTIHQGYLTMDGGIRVGVCGNAATENGKIIGVNSVSGLNIRIPHPPQVSAEPILNLFREMNGMRGILIYSPPGVGKTTLLRAAAIQASNGLSAWRTVVVDTREELAPALNGSGLMLDVLVGYPKELGIEIAVRSMGAQLVICDEIGGNRDAGAILLAANCGVPLIASAHAASADELIRRPCIRQLHRAEIFGAYVGLTRAGEHSFRYRITRREELSL